MECIKHLYSFTSHHSISEILQEFGRCTQPQIRDEARPDSLWVAGSVLVTCIIFVYAMSNPYIEAFERGMESAPNRVRRAYEYGVRLINLVSEAIAHSIATISIVFFQTLLTTLFIGSLAMIMAMVIVGTEELLKSNSWPLRN